MKIENIDYCEVMRSKSFLYHHIFQYLEADSHGALHKCPFDHEMLIIRNYSAIADDYTAFPVGDYFLVLKLSSEADPVFFKLILFYNVKRKSGEEM